MGNQEQKDKFLLVSKIYLWLKNSFLEWVFDKLFCSKIGEKVFNAQLVASKRIIFVFISLYFLNACVYQENTADLQQLRITNSSNSDIIDLVVLFPGFDENSEANRVEFGDVLAGETTDYKDVPSGVYKYAAYEYTLGNHSVSQFVIDWVGERPIAGNKFTYQIRIDPNKVEGDQIILVAVVVDEP